MAAIPVEFTYYTGLARDIFHDARLAGSWDAAGRYSDVWTEQPMAALRTEDGGRGFRATVTFDESQIGSTFRCRRKREKRPSAPTVSNARTSCQRLSWSL